MKKRALIEAVENRMLLSANVTLNFTGTSEPVMLWKSGSTVRFGRWSGDTYYFDSNNSNPNTSSGPNSSWSWASNDPRTFIIKLGGGADTFTIDPSFVTAGIGLLTFNIDGENGWDTITGGANNDTITGGADTGRDQLSGSGGNDSLTGGDGDDTINGDTGHDTVEAGLGADSVVGGSGNDYLVGSTGQDTMQGGADDDVIIGGDANDTIDGGSGDDRLFGEGGVDSITGGAGVNVMFGGIGTTSNTFVDGGGTSIVLLHNPASWSYNGIVESPSDDVYIELQDDDAAWAENSVTQISSAFIKLRNRTGNNRLLRTSDSSSIPSADQSERLRLFRSIQDPTYPTTALALNDDNGTYSSGNIVLYTLAFTTSQTTNPVWSTLLHEIGHNWDQAAENSSASGLQSQGSVWVSSYATSSVYEDFAETFAATFNPSSPRYTGATYNVTAAAAKMTYMNNWLDTI